MKPPRKPAASEWDVSRIQPLANELGDPKPALRFLAKYLSMIRENHFDEATQALPALQQTADRCLASRSSVIRAAHATLNRRRGYFHS
ncbi:hypothetical protein ACLRGI_04010 [Paenarthrobacter nitroguajacolicus]|uniref:hypothetical protein n=1 Tax=Paenarthrobacter nitroguajacolicus TaxID=211146 RepID=UPI003AE23FA8